MILVDTNLLIYATDKSNQRHDAVRAWLEQRLTGGGEVGFAWIALLGFIRITTNFRVMRNCFSIAQAISHVSAWLANPGARIIGPTAAHWQQLQTMLRSAGTGGNLTTDAHLAALAAEHDCELCAADGDFSRFAGLKWRNPLKAAHTKAES